MVKRSILAVIALLATGALFAQAYKWVDEDGVVHYSDRPHEGAVEMELPSDGVRTPGINSLPVRTVFSVRDGEDQVEPFRYDSLAITAPAAEETLWNIEGVLDVNLRMSPVLQSGHVLSVYLDGRKITVATANFRIEDVYRGAHNLQAEIVDKTGRLLIRSENTRFYVQQTSIANPPR